MSLRTTTEVVRLSPHPERHRDRSHGRSRDRSHGRSRERPHSRSRERPHSRSRERPHSRLRDNDPIKRLIATCDGKFEKTVLLLVIVALNETVQVLGWTLIMGCSMANVKLKAMLQESPGPLNLRLRMEFSKSSTITRALPARVVLLTDQLWVGFFTCLISAAESNRKTLFVSSMLNISNMSQVLLVKG
jgi:hypothetical protein